MVSYGKKIEKIECTNHVIKNYTKALLKMQGLSRNVKKLITRPIIKRLVKGARGAIIYNSKNGKNHGSLREDLRNGPYHVVGMHQHCKEYFCSSKSNEEVLLEGYNIAHIECNI